MTPKNGIALAIVVALIIAAIVYLEMGKPKHSVIIPAQNEVAVNAAVQTADYPLKAAQFPRAQELVAPDGYLNTPDEGPITIGSYVGKKVILVDFWTYSCINCQRTIPYVEAWYKKYKSAGLVVIGVHAPEFEFEKKKENVAAAIAKFGITYPVVQDNELATWDAYKNQYWPEEYLIDINGLVVERNIGEGGYADTEATIQKLLAERKQVLHEAGVVPGGTVDITQTITANSPETYFGWSRNDYLGNGRPHASGLQAFSLPGTLQANKLYLGGSWDVQPQYAQTQAAGASVQYSYDSGDVYLVASSVTPVVIEVLQDGKPVGAAAGADVAADGTVTVQESRLYKLVHNATPGPHVIELRVRGAGVQFYTFTFG